MKYKYILKIPDVPGKLIQVMALETENVVFISQDICIS